MFKHGFPPEWSTLKKLIWLVGIGIAGAASGIWKTVTGTLIHITDALASPMQKCEVTLEPIQDLHGQDAPYPAGGGKNKWNTQPYVSTSIGYNSAEGTEASFQEGSGATVSGNSISYSVGAWQGFFFKTSPLPAGTYHLHVDLSAITNSRVSIYTVGSDNKIGAPSNYTVSAAIDSNRNVEEGGYVAIYIGSNTAQTITFSNYQIESGSAYTSWSPFANICPITGWTGCEVTVAGKNIGIVKNLYVGGNTGLAIGDDGVLVCFNAINGQTYKISGASGNRSLLYKFRGRMEDIKAGASMSIALVDTGGVPYTFTANETCIYCFYRNNTWSESIANAMIVGVGNSPLVYEAPNITTLSVTFPDTVYGGTVDLVSGLLTVDSGILDLGSLDYTKSSYIPNGFVAISGMPNDFPIAPSVTAIPNWFCSQYKISSNIGLENPSKDFAIGWRVSGTAKGVIIKDSTYASYYSDNDMASFKTAMSGVQLVYELAESTEIQLTPQEISTLQGINNVWSNTNADTTIIYKAQAE